MDVSGERSRVVFLELDLGTLLIFVHRRDECAALECRGVRVNFGATP